MDRRYYYEWDKKKIINYLHLQMEDYLLQRYS